MEINDDYEPESSGLSDRGSLVVLEAYQGLDWNLSRRRRSEKSFLCLVVSGNSSLNFGRGAKDSSSRMVISYFVSILYIALRRIYI